LSAGELGLDQLGAAIGTLSERLDRVEAAALRRDQMITDFVIGLVQSVDELRGRGVLLGQVEGVIAGRRVS
jgi:hypothetical protein